MEDKIKELISMYLKNDAYKKEDIDEILDDFLPLWFFCLHILLKQIHILMQR